MYLTNHGKQSPWGFLFHTVRTGAVASKVPTAYSMSRPLHSSPAKAIPILRLQAGQFTRDLFEHSRLLCVESLFYTHPMRTSA